MTTKRKARTPVTLDATASELVPTPRRIDLKSLKNVRSEMSRVYREVRGGVIESGEGTKLVFMLAQIGKMIVVADLEKRLVQLEDASYGRS